MSALPPAAEAALARTRCWDAEVEALYAETGVPRADAALQNRAELRGLLSFIVRHDIQSVLELGCWTGALSRCLHAAFPHLRLAVADDGYVEGLGLPWAPSPAAARFRGRVGTPEYAAFRAALGRVDLVFIDADHRYAAVRADFLREQAAPHRFLALHDITGANRHTRGVARLWRELPPGHTAALVRPMEELGRPWSEMGIGFWSAAEAPMDFGPPAWPPGRGG
jgi:hypothetical protein